MPFQFKSEEVHCIMKACENHTFSGPKPACLANLTQTVDSFGERIPRPCPLSQERCDGWYSQWHCWLRFGLPPILDEFLQRHASVGYLQYGQNGKPS